MSAFKITAGNERRSEIVVEGLREKPVKLKATFQAQCAVEGRLNMGILTVLERVGIRDARFREMAAVFEEFSAAGGSQLTEAEIEQLCLDEFEHGWALFVECMLSVFGKKQKQEPPAGKVDAPPAG